MKIQKSMAVIALTVLLSLGNLPIACGEITYLETKFGKQGFNSGEFNNPVAIEIVDDTIYISDSSRVQSFDMDYNFLGEFDGSDSANSFSNVVGMDNNGTHLFTSDYGNDQVKVFDLNGNFVGATSPGVVDNPFGLKYYENELYVASFLNHSIVVFNATTLEFNRELGGVFGYNYLNSPRGIDIFNDMIYVADSTNDTVKIFTIDGRFVGYFGYDGYNKASSLDVPTGVVIHDEKVFVGDAFKDRIVVFDLGGNMIDVIYAELDAPRQFDFTSTSLLISEESDDEVTVLRLVASPKEVTAMTNGVDIQLSWDIDPSMGISDPESYKIYRNNGSGNEYLGSTDDMNFIDAIVTQGKTYTYKIKAVSGLGESNLVSSNAVSISEATSGEGNTTDSDDEGSFLDAVPVSIYSVVTMLMVIPIIRKKNSQSHVHM